LTVDLHPTIEHERASQTVAADNVHPVSEVQDRFSAEHRARLRNQVALVEGSTPALASETNEQLRFRLRVAALLFFAGFLAFLVMRFVVWGTEAYSKAPSLLVMHVAMMTLMGAVAAALCRKCEIAPWKLRVAELLVFGDPAIFFIALAYQKTIYCATLAENAFLPQTVAPFLMLMFTYALFVPNTWRRALAILAGMGLAPVAVAWYSQFTVPAVDELIRSGGFAGYPAELALMMILAVTTGTAGVHVIGSLRREAFTARQLGQYRLKERIGAGGMGEVYLAEHEMMKRPCAVKIIRPEKAGDPSVIARFEREVRSTAKLSHWNSIDIYDYGRTANGTFYYVMEFLPGHHLGELVEFGGPLPAGRVVHLMEQVCAALSEAHGIGLVHRDIKPANIFCAYKGGIYDVAKLLDFGLAKPFYEPVDTALTQENVITGSPLFMSPEQATGDSEPDARSDIYSLGAVMYVTLTGQAPFEYANPMKAMIAHATDEVVPPREVNADIPAELDQIVLRCLQKLPDERFQDAESLRLALRAVPLTKPWTPQQAVEWWNCHGCPEKKRRASEALEAAAV
jgi:serine/threonine-protein kinase